MLFSLLLLDHVKTIETEGGNLRRRSSLILICLCSEIIMVAKRCFSWNLFLKLKLFSQLHKTVQPAPWKQDDCYTFQVFFSEWIILRRGNRLALLSPIFFVKLALFVGNHAQSEITSFIIQCCIVSNGITGSLYRAKFVWQTSYQYCVLWMI